jgi:hypothetical protein
MFRIARPLTAGEIAMSRLLFGDAIDYSRVRVHNTRYLPLVQPKSVCITPNGSLYFHASRFRDDFSAAPEDEQHWFMHEMAHVWQHQLGYPVRLRGAIRLGLSYDYELSAGLSLCDYNMEAQAELLADYFLLRFLHGADTAVYDPALEPFLTDPSNPCHLPGARRAA